ncbi:monopolin-like complex subunit Mde4 [Schizosaccharomyces japonicus yFS275]|uniref:Monopolin-like complex subunit Mde4 n=1 Tax=Schizosaccharomyces japonicus (strain yFS275 / FY16936) TaxID=402676 RepID=B6JW76_SCHJY|nr:monopolin-like complex subunit Mde4 [Schizosaccharomyces japonicus yFS275]EEB05627.1 monopolin-like complex subunit Mde4 [Schizosaccharomyces japonicus yFS275]
MASKLPFMSLTVPGLAVRDPSSLLELVQLESLECKRRADVHKTSKLALLLALTVRNQLMETKLHTADAHIISYVGKLQRSKSSLQSKKKQLVSVLEELDENENKLGSAEKELVQLKEEYKQLQEDLIKLSKKTYESEETIRLLKSSKESGESATFGKNVESSSSTTRLHNAVNEYKKLLKAKEQDITKLQSSVSARDTEIDRWRIRVETIEANWKARVQVLESKLATLEKKTRLSRSAHDRKSTSSTMLSSPQLVTNSPSPQKSSLSSRRSIREKSSLSMTPFLKKTSVALGLSSSPLRRDAKTLPKPLSPNKSFSETRSRLPRPSLSPSKRTSTNVDGDSISQNLVQEALGNGSLKKKRKLEAPSLEVQPVDEENELHSDEDLTLAPPKRASSIVRAISPLKARSETVNSLKKGFSVKQLEDTS